MSNQKKKEQKKKERESRVKIKLAKKRSVLREQRKADKEQQLSEQQAHEIVHGKQMPIINDPNLLAEKEAQRARQISEQLKKNFVGFTKEYKEEFEQYFESKHEDKWKEVSGKLQKTFQFKDFKEALDFINKVGKISESMNHHPEIINVYNKVTLKLKTHDENKITDLDKKMSKKVDELFNI